MVSSILNIFMVLGVSECDLFSVFVVVEGIGAGPGSSAEKLSQLLLQVHRFRQVDGMQRMKHAVLPVENFHLQVCQVSVNSARSAVSPSGWFAFQTRQISRAWSIVGTFFRMVILRPKAGSRPPGHEGFRFQNVRWNTL